MITELPTYCLHGISKYAQNTNLEELYTILFYKSWHLLSGYTNYSSLEFQLNGEFTITDGEDTQHGEWKVVRDKHVILTFKGTAHYCHVAFYDGNMLVLKVYGQRLYIVLLDSFVFTTKPVILYTDIEAYLRGDKQAVNALWKSRGPVVVKRKEETDSFFTCMMQLVFFFVVVIVLFILWMCA